MYAIEMKHIVKKFGSFTANDDISLCVRKGEIHSLLGENGAGKTTLMNILYGLYGADSGEILINGKEVHLKSPLDAIYYGISMVHQHFMLVDALTVAENVVLGSEPHRGIRFNYEQACKEVAELGEAYGLYIDPKEMVKNLPVGVKQRVEILKALYHKSDILILDEPTAVLTPQEVNEFFEVLKHLRAMGKTTIIITHKLKETIKIADTLTILRKGRFILSRTVKGADEKELAEQMVGRQVLFEVDRKEMPKQQNIALSLEGITYYKRKKVILNDISLDLQYGEILGIAGVEGNGQTELIEVITGLTHPDNGTVSLNGELIKEASARRILDLGIAHIPEDRGARGSVSAFTLWENYILGYHRKCNYQKRGILDVRRVRNIMKTVIDDFGIRCNSTENLMKELSGGNQQKLIIARALSQSPDVLIAAQPTRGVDIGAIEYIHEQLIRFRNQGKSIILISADLDEIMKLSDRIAVIFEGKIVADRPVSMFTIGQLGSYMLGNAAGEVANGEF